jgi:hypothetical protein
LPLSHHTLAFNRYLDSLRNSLRPFISLSQTLILLTRFCQALYSFFTSANSTLLLGDNTQLLNKNVSYFVGDTGGIYGTSGINLTPA